LERFEIVVDGATSSVVLRVLDAMGNVATARAEAPGKF
jgi:hypothetical protein